MNKKGIALILAFIVIVVLTALGGIVIMRSISESRIALRSSETAQAFWLAEAAVNRALAGLKSSYSVTGTDVWSDTLIEGRYSVDIENVTINGQACKKIIAHGFVPATGTVRIQRNIEAIIDKFIPPNFYDNAIYSAGNVVLNGSAYNVTGDVRYATTINNTSNITGTTTQDPSITPLARLDFQELYDKSTVQHNVYVKSGSKMINSFSGLEGFPGTFWFTRADDSIDNDSDGTVDENDEWVPNVVYVDGDLTLSGNIGTIGGFFVVAGDVINTPDVTQDAVINGNGTIEGTIYTRGEFRINGGGGNLNVNGGIWAGEQTRINGNANVTYNAAYMSAIENLNINADVRMSSWKDGQNHYTLVP